MRPIVIAALIAALLGAFGLALGRSAANAVERAVTRHATGVERALSLQDAAIPTHPRAPIPLRGQWLFITRPNPC
jgi:sensor domain CHASE-containing protein